MKIKTLQAGNREFTRLEESTLTILRSGNYLIKEHFVRGRRSITGFTLIELVIVLFIIGLSASVVIFSAGRLQDKALFKEEARKLFLTIGHARNISLMEKRNVEFRIDRDENRYWIDYGNEKSSNTHILPKKFTIEGDTLFFFPKGNSSGGSVKIVNDKGQEYEIEVNPVLGTPSFKRL
ncbi:MAG: type II secretion system protein [Nitrospirota bacterium]